MTHHDDAQNYGCSQPFWLGLWLWGTPRNITVPIPPTYTNFTTLEINYPDGLNDELVAPPAETLENLWLSDQTLVEQFVDKNFQLHSYQSTVTRATLRFGGPYRAYDANNTGDLCPGYRIVDGGTSTARRRCLATISWSYYEPTSYLTTSLISRYPTLFFFFLRLLEFHDARRP